MSYLDVLPQIQNTTNFGTGLFNATQQDDPLPSGSFFSWVAQGQRLQRLTKDQLLIIQGSLQPVFRTSFEKIKIDSKMATE
jgi:hemolysin activation/secretion protein